MVYIDAAFDRADDSADYDAKLRELPRNPGPQASGLGSIATLRDYLSRNEMPSFPEAEVRNRYVVDPEGNISGQKMPASAVREGISATMRAAVSEYDPEPIRVPALAVYAVPDEPVDLMRAWYDQSGPSVQQSVPNYAWPNTDLSVHLQRRRTDSSRASKTRSSPCSRARASRASAASSGIRPARSASRSRTRRAGMRSSLENASQFAFVMRSGT